MSMRNRSSLPKNTHLKKQRSSLGDLKSEKTSLKLPFYGMTVPNDFPTVRGRFMHMPRLRLWFFKAALTLQDKNDFEQRTLDCFFETTRHAAIVLLIGPINTTLTASIVQNEDLLNSQMN